MRYNSGQTSSRLFLMLALTIFASGVLLSWLLMSSSLFKTPRSTPAPVPDQAQPLDIPTVAPEQQAINIDLSQPTEPKLLEYGTRGPVNTATPASQQDSDSSTTQTTTATTTANDSTAKQALTIDATPTEPDTDTKPEQIATTPDTNNAVPANTAAANNTSKPETADDTPNTDNAATEDSAVANNDAKPATAASSDSSINPEQPAANNTAQTAATETQNAFSSEQSGWIYAGEYKNTEWLSSNLDIDNTQLPQEGAVYPVRRGTNVRSAPPSNQVYPETGTKLAPTVAYLGTDAPVQVIQVKFSGNSGHLWLNVNY